MPGYGALNHPRVTEECRGDNLDGGKRKEPLEVGDYIEHRDGGPCDSGVWNL